MHLHRSSALGYASAASAEHSRVYGACAAEAAASESSGLSVGGCIRASTDFRPCGGWLNLSPSRDSARRNTAHAWTDGPPPATFTV